jgi:signal transduction histidine kinase
MTRGESNRDGDCSKRRHVARSSTPRLVSDGGLSRRDLFDAFPDPIIYYEVEQDTAVVREVNPAFKRCFDIDGAAISDDRLANHLLVDTVECESDPCWERADPADDAAEIDGVVETDDTVETDGPEKMDDTVGTDDSEGAATEANAEEILTRLFAGEQVTVRFHPRPGDERHDFRLEAVSPSNDGNEGYIVYTTVTDLTQQVNHHRTRANRLERVASVTAHDLRNPLDVAKIRLEAARDTGESVHFENVEEALDRIQRIIQNVLSVGGGEIDPSDAVVLDEIAEAAWSTVETADATLVLEDDMPTIRSDADRLQQIFENLFRNAVEHASTTSQPEADDAVEHGSTDVTVTVGSLADGFYVADDGAGIPAAERDRVFEPGYSTAETNTGLGLAIVQQIAENHGWQVDSTSSAAGGARFEFTGVEIEEDA